MRIIGCRIENEYIVAAEKVAGAVGSHDDVLLFLHFNDMWEGLTKSITWLDANGENPTITMLTADLAKDDTGLKYLVPVPGEAKAVEGEMFMTIKGVSVEGQTEKTATLSAFTNFTVLPSRWDPDAQEAADVTPTIAEQLQAEIDEVLDNIFEAIESKEAAAQSAADSAQSAAAAGNSALAASTAAQNTQALYTSFMEASAAAETLPAGSSATVVVTDVSGHKLFTFGIPRGATGPKGDKGDKGDPGSGSGDMLASVYDPHGKAKEVLFIDSVIDGGTW